MSTEGIILDFKNEGINRIDIDLLATKWNHLWWIAQWDNRNSNKSEYRLIKMLRRNSSNTALKTDISEVQAKEIIDRMKLSPLDGGFRSATTWRKLED